MRNPLATGTMLGLVTGTVLADAMSGIRYRSPAAGDRRSRSTSALLLGQPFALQGVLAGSGSGDDGAAAVDGDCGGFEGHRVVVHLCECDAVEERFELGGHRVG